MRHARDVDPSGSSVEVRIAAAMVGAGAVLGILLLVGAGLLFTADPGFLFVVIPFVMGAALMTGLYILTGSVTVARQLLRHAPGARLQTGVIGFCVCLAGLAGIPMDPRIGLPVAVYGAVLCWLMTTAAAAGDLGAWIVPRTARTRPMRPPPFMSRWMRPPTTAEQPPAFFTGAEPAATGVASPYFLGAQPPRNRQRPATWIELWQEGLGRIPISDLVVLVVALIAFVVGDVLMLMNLVGAAHGGLLIALALIGGSIAVFVVLERRLLVRLGYA